MGLLLDTHVWLWSQAFPERLGPLATARLRDRSTVVAVSTISTLELARLVASRRIEVDPNLSTWVDRSLAVLGATTVELDHAIALEAYALGESFHRDPADRILVATARVRQLDLMTADERILSFEGARSVDARR